VPVLPIDSIPLSAATAPRIAVATVPASPFRSRVMGWLQKCGDGHYRGAQLAIDGSIILLSFLTAFDLRYEGDFSYAHLLQMVLWAPILVGVRMLLIHTSGVHRFLWRFVCLSDVIAIAQSLMWVTAALLLLRWFYPPSYAFAYWLRLPLGILVPEYSLSLGGLITIRSICRIAQERRDRAALDVRRGRKRVLLYGAGRAGVMLVHELASHGGLEVVGFIDDDPHKCRSIIAGKRVLGSGANLSTIVCHNQINEVMISIATPPPGMISRILSQCNAIPIKTTIVPPAQEIIAGRVRISRVREVRIEDLLGRTSAATGEYPPLVRAAYHGKQVLVTGAGGSIGSELCRQLLLLNPDQLIMLDKDENSIYDLEQELRFCHSKSSIEPVIADIKIAERISSIFKEYRPQVVVHAAAHKHVPLMEKHPCEAVLNNVMGMNNVLEICRDTGVERVVFISSDKAVNPANVMGATKRIGEKLLQLYTSGNLTNAASVRFGNVMGSRGSVIPLFKRQIEQGGPVTVTHPDIVRFFMTIPEAVQLVLYAGSLANCNEIFVLDMGNPRRVLDLAREMIELAGFRPDRDIAIEITGLRPGEKMEEELACGGESLNQTRFEKISEIAHTPFDEVDFRNRVDMLIQVARDGDRGALIETLMAMELGYQPAQRPIPRADDRDEMALAS
jgi:FlaA1/EpsC-like NDP-sugar epimerase